MDSIERDLGSTGLKSCAADHLYKSSNMSVRGRRGMKEGLALSKAAGTYKKEAEVRYLIVSMYIVG